MGPLETRLINLIDSLTATEQVKQDLRSEVESSGINNAILDKVKAIIDRQVEENRQAIAEQEAKLQNITDQLQQKLQELDEEMRQAYADAKRAKEQDELKKIRDQLK